MIVHIIITSHVIALETSHLQKTIITIYWFAIFHYNSAIFAKIACTILAHA